MFTSEVKEIFDSHQSISYEGSYNIGAACNHFGGTDFRTIRVGNGRTFGLNGDPQDFILFSKLLMDSNDPKQAMEHSGLSKYKAVKLIGVLNTAAEKRGLPPVHALKPKSPRKVIRVKCDQTGQVFRSTYEACRALDLNLGHMSSYINGRKGYKSVKGYTFSRTKAKPQGVQESRKINRQGSRKIKITCDQTGQVFPSMAEACRAYGLTGFSLSCHMAGDSSHRTVKGYTFTPTDKRLNDIQKGKFNAAKEIGNKPIKITCDQTGQVFPSIREAERLIGANNSNLCSHLKGRPHYRTVGGYTFSKVSRNQEAAVNSSQSSKASA